MGLHNRKRWTVVRLSSSRVYTLYCRFSWFLNICFCNLGRDLAYLSSSNCLILVYRGWRDMLISGLNHFRVQIHINEVLTSFSQPSETLSLSLKTGRSQQSSARYPRDCENLATSTKTLLAQGLEPESTAEGHSPCWLHTLLSKRYISHMAASPLNSLILSLK